MVSPSAQNFVPAWRYISNISNAVQAVVSFTIPHTYIPGQYLSFRVSPPYGMVEFNNLQTIVLSVSEYTVTVGVNSMNFIPFTTPTSAGSMPAMAVPAGSGIVAGTATVTLQDAFDQLPGN